MVTTSSRPHWSLPAYRHDRRRRGLCADCDNRSPRHYRCSKCRARQRAYDRSGRRGRPELYPGLDDYILTSLSRWKTTESTSSFFQRVWEEYGTTNRRIVYRRLSKLIRAKRVVREAPGQYRRA